MVSHELQTPLTAIKGALELVLDEDEGRLSRVQRRFLDTIDRNSARLISLVGDLLDLSRLDAGRLQLDLRPLDTPALVNGCVSALSHLFERRGQTVRVLVPDTVPPILGDRRRVDQILTNLLSNAAKYTPDGGIIEVSAQMHGQRITVIVADSGPGIPRVRARRSSSIASIEGGTLPGAATLAAASGLQSCGHWWSYTAARSTLRHPLAGATLGGAWFVLELPRAPDDE